jgi:hypothetical protein
MSTYDQRNQIVEKQINISIQGPPSVDLEGMIDQGMRLLKIRSYQQSADLFRRVLIEDPQLTDICYYLSLALLKGRRPKVLSRKEVEEIDQFLSTSMATGDYNSTILWFRILLREDYYNGNRMRCPAPSLSELIESIRPDSTSIEDLRMLLAEIPMAGNGLYDQLKAHVLHIG